jgi:hypothetical protein
MLALLYACAGEPLLKTVAFSATETLRKLHPEESVISIARISHWRRGKSMPQRWGPFEAVLVVLIGEARKKGTPPPMDGLYDLRQWRQRWQDARTASDDAADQAPQIPETTCPYKGLAAFEVADSARFFGRARSVNELVALINRVQATDPGIVLVTGPSGAG